MVINRVKGLLGKKRTEEVTYTSPEAKPSFHTEPQTEDPRPPGHESAGASPQSASLDEYFDQLDAAFSNLQPGAPPSDGSEEVDWPADLDPRTAAVHAPAAGPRALVPSSNVRDVPAFIAPVAAAPIARAATNTPVAEKAVNPFAILSAARAEAAARPVAQVITDEVIEEIVSRVLRRMSDHVVRETVTGIVSQTAERLVQQEIERIRTGGGT